MSVKPGAGEPEGGVSKVKVKKQIRTIVQDLETILGDLKDVAKELKAVVHDIDSLTGDLQLEEEMTDSSKTDTLNSSSSSTTTTTTASSMDKPVLRPPTLFPTVLSVMKKPHPPLPPPRLTPPRAEDLAPIQLSGNSGKVVCNGAVPGKQPDWDSCCVSKNPLEKVPGGPALRHDKPRCTQVQRERVRFSEKVQYHGYCPDCGLQYDMENEELPLCSELPSPAHCCSPLTLENGGLSTGHSFAPIPSSSSFSSAATQPCVPRPLPGKPQKTILRKSTTTTV